MNTTQQTQIVDSTYDMGRLGIHFPNGGQSCGGVRITKDIILTAAHCLISVYKNSKGQTINELPHTIYWNFKNPVDEKRILVIKALEWIIHPKYQPTQMMNYSNYSDYDFQTTRMHDIALIKLDVYPEFFSLGWLTPEPFYKLADQNHLSANATQLQMRLPIHISREANYNQDSKIELSQLYSFNTHIINILHPLGRFSFSPKNQFICPGDSGSAIMLQGTNLIVGLLSSLDHKKPLQVHIHKVSQSYNMNWHQPCRNSTTYATWVYPYLDWIESSTQKLNSRHPAAQML